jgi:hypothetical protein
MADVRPKTLARALAKGNGIWDAGHFEGFFREEENFAEPTPGFFIGQNAKM